MLNELGRQRESHGTAQEAAGREREPTDAQLVRQAKSDRAAFAQLYDRYLGSVFRFCLLRLRTREAAEDATSQTFVRAMQSIRDCQPDRFRPWLFTIARNVVNDSYRINAAADTSAIDGEIVDPADTPLDLAIANDDERTVIALLRHLSPDQREIVELRLSGLSGAEIAQATRKSRGAVRAVQFRAYSKLRDILRANSPKEWEQK